MPNFFKDLHLTSESILQSIKLKNVILIIIKALGRWKILSPEKQNKIENTLETDM